MKFNGTYEIAAITRLDEKEEENGDDALPIIDAAKTGLETRKLMMQNQLKANR